MVFFLSLVIAAVAAWIGLRQLYWWQVKEYRSDRWWSWTRYNQGWRELFRFSFRKPQLTVRISLILAVLVGGGYLVWPGWIGLIIWGYLGPAVGTLLTWPINELGRIWLTWKAKQRVDQIQPKIVAITGSYGKTRSKEILVDFVASKYRTVKTLRNENTEIGIAKRILADLKSGIEVLIVEVGAYKQGEITQICQMLKPDIAWVTAIGNQHLDLFGGIENLKLAKFELVENLKPGGVAVLNAALGGADLVVWARQKQIKTVVYRASGLQANLAGAREVAKILGVKHSSQLPVTNWVIKTTPRGIKVVDDSYSTNQQGFEAAIAYLKQQQGRKYVVTPGIIELGAATAKVHRELIKQLADLDGVWVTSDWVKSLLGGQDIKTITSTLQAGDIVLIEGRIPSDLKQKILQL